MKAAFLTRRKRLSAVIILNDEYEEAIAPIYPEAPLEHKRYIIEFLTQILGSLDANTSLHDSFTRLGIKLVVYGGCLELSRYWRPDYLRS